MQDIVLSQLKDITSEKKWRDLSQETIDEVVQTLENLRRSEVMVISGFGLLKRDFSPYVLDVFPEYREGGDSSFLKTRLYEYYRLGASTISINFKKGRSFPWGLYTAEKVKDKQPLFGMYPEVTQYFIESGILRLKQLFESKKAETPYSILFCIIKPA